MGTRPLEAARWAGAIDAVGGDLLAWLTRTTKHWGGIASTGLTGGIELRTTVMPFILRGVSLLGIDSATCPMPIRSDVWRRLSTDMKPADLDSIAHEVTLDALPAAFNTLLAGEARGRFVVNLRI
jgi:NADPH2:quinone reductase